MGLGAYLFDVGFHAFNRAADRCLDAAYGVATTAERRPDAVAAAGTRYGDVEMNMPSYYLRLLALRRFLAPGREDVFVDLGCGAGRAVTVFARAGVASRGVEFDPETLWLAQDNARRLAARGTAVEIVRQDAAQYRFDDETIVYLFNPFGRETLRAVLDNLRKSIAARPRRVRIGYYHPLHRDLLEATPWLRRSAILRGFKTDIAVYETHGFRTKPDQSKRVAREAAEAG